MAFPGFVQGDAKDLFLDFVNAQGEVAVGTAAENFAAGFRLGARVMLEILREDVGT